MVTKNAKLVINAHMGLLKKNHSELTKYGGFGYCAYGSELLRIELRNSLPTPVVMIGKTIKDNNKFNIADNLIKTIMSITDTRGIYYDIKKQYLKRNRLQANIGHAVVLIDDTVYDITSDQFGLPSAYPLSAFKDMWETTYIGTVVINDKADFGVDSITKVNQTNHNEITYLSRYW